MPPLRLSPKWALATFCDIILRTMFILTVRKTNTLLYWCTQKKANVVKMKWKKNGLNVARKKWLKSVNAKASAVIFNDHS